MEALRSPQDKGHCDHGVASSDTNRKMVAYSPGVTVRLFSGRLIEEGYH